MSISEAQPPVIQSLWIGPKLSTMEQLSIVSFLQNGHSFHLYAYEEIEGVPPGTTVRDAGEIIPATKIFKYRHHNTYSGFANLFRYRLLLEKGGYWVDTDIVCLRPFNFAAPYMFAGVPTGPQRFRWRKKYHIANWFIKAPPGSEIMNYCYQEAAKRNPEELAFGETGPRLLSVAVKKFSMEQYVAPFATFCPIYAWQWKCFINESFAGRRKWKKALHASYGAHLYHEMWRRNEVDTDSSFPEASIYEQLKRRYLNCS